MKNILVLFICFVFILTACQDEFDPGGTKTAGYAGEWYYHITASDGETEYVSVDEIYAESLPLLTYNSTANNANEIWIDDQAYWAWIKAKFTLTGTPENFKSTGIVVNEMMIETPEVDPEDEVEGTQLVEDLNDNWYLAELLDGRIMKDAATVWPDMQKAKADSIYLKFAFHGGRFHWTVKRNIKVDTVDRIVPTTPATDSAVFDTSFVYVRDTNFFEVLDPFDTIYITGHRQTGWEVDF